MLDQLELEQRMTVQYEITPRRRAIDIFPHTSREANLRPGKNER
jgi:hypothetical protein